MAAQMRMFSDRFSWKPIDTAPFDRDVALIAESARRRLYERARTALLSEMRRAEPALDRSDIMTAQTSLELAICEVEADAQREQRAQAAVRGVLPRRCRSLCASPS
jgi:hypothetical protein